jgi:serine/threonine protein kinase
MRCYLWYACHSVTAPWPLGLRTRRLCHGVDRLIALVQTCSGLEWLYEHGLEGHGDLKPANILLRDLRESFVLPEQGFPSKLHPWQARVADLGWADIWCRGGGTYHAWRPYLAPERFRSIVVPEASDIYAVGVIACELLSGVHPAGDRTELLAKKWNQKKWEAWAASTNRVVNIEPTSLRDLILRCLRPDSSSRPRASDLKAALCVILENTYGLRVVSQLRLQDEQARALMLASHDSWPAEEMSRVSPDQLDVSITQLETNLGELGDASSTEQIAKFLARSRSLQRLLLRRKQPGDLDRLACLASATLDLVLERFKTLDLRAEIYGKPVIAGLTPEEVSWGFAIEAFKNLKQATGIDEPRLKNYQTRLQGLYSEAWREVAERFAPEVLGKNSNS